MLKQLLVTTLTSILALNMCAAKPLAEKSAGLNDLSNGKLVLRPGQIPANNGKAMYTSYCAPCHGIDGRGNGPAAPSLKVQPIDLTEMSKHNQGKYPSAHVMAVLQFGSEMTSHGSAQMPIWGPILGTVSRTNAQDKQLRMSNLSRYLETIQVK